MQCVLEIKERKISVYIFYFISSEFLNYERYFVLKVVLTYTVTKNCFSDCEKLLEIEITRTIYSDME